MKGWIKLHRRILDNGIIQDADLTRMFVWCILKANHTKKNFLDIKIEIGSFVTGRSTGSEELNMKPSTFYKKLNQLQKRGYIKLEPNKKFTLVNVCNYNHYQIENEKAPTETIDKRKNKFKEQIKEYIQEVPKHILTEFFNYWTETNKSGTKMRFELERTWSLNLRLKRWVNNGFNKDKNKMPDYFDEVLYKKMDMCSKKEYEKKLKQNGFSYSYNPNSGGKWIKKAGV